MRIRTGGLAVLLALAVAPASALAASSVTIPDGCGDASATVASVNGTGAGVPTGREGTYDISSATLTAVPGGAVEAQLKACAAIPASDRIGGSWQIAAGVADGCTVSFALIDDRTDGRYGAMSIGCPSVLATPLGDLPGVSEVYNRKLGADEWSVAADTVSFHLSSQALRPEHIGNTWTDPYAHSFDGARTSEMYFGSIVSANGPGAEDTASTTGTLDRG